MKFVGQKHTQLKATKVFTDREEPRQTFWRKFEDLTNDDSGKISVISYYGFGGIGKTALLRHLNEELRAKYPSSPSIVIDFDHLISGLKYNTFDILRYIEHELKDKYKFSFPIFDLVAYTYEIKQGKEATKPALKSIFDENESLSFLKDLIDEIPLIGAVSKIASLASLADKGRTLFSNRSSEKKFKERFSNIDKCSAAEIEPKLAYFFAQDLSENTRKLQQPFVIFIDTYEALVNEFTTGNPLERDLFIRSDDGLICNTENTLWVIGGREILKWDDDWEGSLEQHLLGELSFKDSKSFLETAGILNSDLIHEIYNLTHGSPMWLDMCVDVYAQLIEEGKTPTIADFGKDTTKLVNRFLIYMGDEERDFIQMLAEVGEWTDDNIVDYSRKILGTFKSSLYDKIKTFSFIVHENEHYHLQEYVHDIIVANTPDNIRNAYIKISEEQTSRQLANIVADSTEEADHNTTVKSTIKLKKQSSKAEAQKILLGLLDEINQYDLPEQIFTPKAKFLLSEIAKYEEEFDEPFSVNYLKISRIRHKTPEALLIIMRNGYEHQLPDRIYKLYEQLRDLGYQDATYPLKYFLRFVLPRKTYLGHSSAPEEHAEDFVRLMKQEFGVNSDYYFAALYFASSVPVNGKYTYSQMFVSMRDTYRPEPMTKFFIYIYAAHLANLSEYFYLGAGLDEYKKTHRDPWENNDEDYWWAGTVHELANEILPTEFNKFREILEDNPDKITPTLLEIIFNIYPELPYYDLKSRLAIFDYIYSIRNLAITTSNLQILDRFYQLFRAFLGGHDDKAGMVIKDESAQQKILDFFKQLRKRLIELYGKEDSRVIEIDGLIGRSTVKSSAALNMQIEAIIEKYGLTNSKTYREITLYLRDYKPEYDDADDYFQTVFELSQKYAPYFTAKNIDTDNDISDLLEVFDSIIGLERIDKDRTTSKKATTEQRQVFYESIRQASPALYFDYCSRYMESIYSCDSLLKDEYIKRYISRCKDIANDPHNSTNRLDCITYILAEKTDLVISLHYAAYNIIGAGQSFAIHATNIINHEQKNHIWYNLRGRCFCDYLDKLQHALEKSENKWDSVYVSLVEYLAGIKSGKDTYENLRRKLTLLSPANRKLFEALDYYVDIETKNRTLYDYSLDEIKKLAQTDCGCDS